MKQLTDFGRAYLHLCAALRLADELGLSMAGARMSSALDAMESSGNALEIDLVSLRQLDWPASPTPS
jgi:hypothetical protein